MLSDGCSSLMVVGESVCVVCNVGGGGCDASKSGRSAGVALSGGVGSGCGGGVVVVLSASLLM